jgi:hypothetical protein
LPALTFRPRWIASKIEGAGLKCWISKRDVPKGENFQDAIVEALEKSAAMVLVFSKNANGSREIKKELALASEYGLWVLPVRIEDVQATKGFKYELATSQYIDIFEDRDHGMREVIDALQKHVAGL